MTKYWEGTWRDVSDPHEPHEASRLHLQIDKAHNQLGWSPRWDFETTVERTMNWYKDVDSGGRSIRSAWLTSQPTKHYRPCPTYLQYENPTFLKAEILRLTREYSRQVHDNYRPASDPIGSNGKREHYSLCRTSLHRRRSRGSSVATLDFWLTLGQEKVRHSERAWQYFWECATHW